MIELRETAEGVLLPVKAQPGSRHNDVRGVENGMLKVAVTQVAEKGKANRAVLAVVAQALGLRKSQVLLASGETHRDKQLLIRGLTMRQLQERLSAIGA